MPADLLGGAREVRPMPVSEPAPGLLDDVGTHAKGEADLAVHLRMELRNRTGANQAYIHAAPRAQGVDADCDLLSRQLFM
jgi:hypothetical protein